MVIEQPAFHTIWNEIINELIDYTFAEECQLRLTPVNVTSLKKRDKTKNKTGLKQDLLQQLIKLRLYNYALFVLSWWGEKPDSHGP